MFRSLLIIGFSTSKTTPLGSVRYGLILLIIALHCRNKKPQFVAQSLGKDFVPVVRVMRPHQKLSMKVH